MKYSEKVKKMQKPECRRKRERRLPPSPRLWWAKKAKAKAKAKAKEEEMR